MKINSIHQDETRAVLKYVMVLLDKIFSLKAKGQVYRLTFLGQKLLSIDSRNGIDKIQYFIKE
jgi:hypothetical protein